MSSHFEVRSYRDGMMRQATFERGILQSDNQSSSQEENGTYVHFEPDDTLFKHYKFLGETIETMLRNYTYLNTGLTILFNGRRIVSREGLD